MTEQETELLYEKITGKSLMLPNDKGEDLFTITKKDLKEILLPKPVDKVREALERFMRESWGYNMTNWNYTKFREIFGPLIQDGGASGIGQHDIEYLAEKVHEAYLVTCKKLGWDVKEENQVPYSDLIESSKELDRASVQAVLDNINLIGGASGIEQAKKEGALEALRALDEIELSLRMSGKHMAKSKIKELRNEIEGE